MQPLQLGTMKETSQSKLYSELGFESLKFRRWFRTLCTYFELKTSSVPEYLFDLIPQNNHLYNTRFTFFFSTCNIRMEQIG